MTEPQESIWDEDTVYGPEPWAESVIQCPNCGGDGERIGCFDDLCHARGECMHGGNVVCGRCEGKGVVPESNVGVSDDE